MELFGFDIKKFLIFFQKKGFLIFQETETSDKIFIFQETELSHISGNGNPKKFLIIHEVTFQARKIKKSTLKKFLIFREIELSSPKFKKFFLF